MDPVSAIASAIGDIANAATYIGSGRRQSRARWGQATRPGDLAYENHTGTLLIAAGVLILLVIIIVIAKK